MRLLAIDPGLANTGMVLFVDGAIVDAQTITTKGAGRKTEFNAALHRCATICAIVSDAIERMDPDMIVVELYKDIPGHLRKAANRWTTPMLIGYLHARVLDAILEAHVDVVYQDPEQVMTAYREVVGMWAAGRRGIWPGDERLTNEHLRSAAAHAVHRIAIERAGGRR